MRLLIKRALILDSTSSHHGKRFDVYMKKGVITSIGRNLKVTADAIVQSGNLCISPGWMDIGARSGEPGYEHRESLVSLSKAAIAGGYTAVACFPNTQPALHSKSEIEFIRNKSTVLPIHLYPIGAISEDCAGRDLAELYDMHVTGAVAFSDGRNTTAHAGLLMRALQYVTSFNGLVINRPDDKLISPDGQVHESATSVRMGLKGLPSLREHIMIERDLRILEYTQSRLHIFGISSADSVSLIRQGQRSGLHLTASVPAVNLLLEDTHMEGFDTHLKVLPPLRSKTDRRALIRGIRDGVITCIVSNHEPVEEEHKKMEFAFADFGSTGLETAFGMANAACDGQVGIAELVKCFSEHPRTLLGIPATSITEKQIADVTIFDPDITWTAGKAHLASKSANAAALGQQLKGAVLGTVVKGEVHLASEK